MNLRVLKLLLECWRTGRWKHRSKASVVPWRQLNRHLAGGAAAQHTRRRLHAVQKDAHVSSIEALESAHARGWAVHAAA